MVSHGLAIIIANLRGRQPNAHFEPLAGAPAISRLIKNARATAGIAQVWVVTDDVALGDSARAAGADHVLREPFDISESDEQRVHHALEDAESQAAFRADLVRRLDLAFPLLRPSDLERLIGALDVLAADCACAAVFSQDLVACRVALAENVVFEAEEADVLTRGASLMASGAAEVARASMVRATGKLRAGRIALERFDAYRQSRVESVTERAIAEVILREDDRANRKALLPTKIKAVIFDFDGVMTDNAVWVTQDGVESVRCDRGDGMGIGLLKARGVKILILSKERNPVVSARAKKLGIECLQGIDNKLDELKRWLANHEVLPEQALYAGNDVNDLECMRHVGCAIAPKDAHDSALSAAHLVLTRDGGRGAVRELCDLILETMASGSDFS